MLSIHDPKILKLQNTRETLVLKWDTPKENLWCRVMQHKIIRPFFFAEKSNTAQIYLDFSTEYIAQELRHIPLISKN